MTAPERAGLAAILAATLILILTSLYAAPPRSTGCVKPTAMPATWFDECEVRR